MNGDDLKGMRILDAIYDSEELEHDLGVKVGWTLKVRAGQLLEEGWVRYLASLRAAREAEGAVPIQDDLPREVVIARLSALQARFPDRVVAIGHQRLAAMTDGDLQSLLADVEELLASE